MAEETTSFVAPICTIPKVQIILGKLNELRQSRSRLRKESSIKENEAQQNVVKKQLIDMGREDLINY